MTKRQMQHEASVLRRAAQYYEKSSDAYYPCFAVGKFDPADGSYASPGTLANRFIRAVCPGKTPPIRHPDDDIASDRFLRRVNLDTPKGRDHCILALCFAAAMAETGDL